MRFELEWRDRHLVGPEGPRLLGRQTQRRFLDYVIDGEALYERHGADFISCLGWLDREDDDLAAQRLLCRDVPDLDGRVAVYICPEDADLLCGAITVIVGREGEEFVWRDMAFSYPDWDKTEGTHQAWSHDSTGFEEWQELRFPAAVYEQTIVGRSRP